MCVGIERETMNDGMGRKDEMEIEEGWWWATTRFKRFIQSERKTHTKVMTVQYSD